MKFKQKILTAILAVALTTSFFSACVLATEQDLGLACESAILMDRNTGRILYEKNADKQLYPASTTKIMTGILTLENAKLDDMVTIDSKTPFEIHGSHIALEPDEQLSVKDLLYATMIESANDAALTLAKHVGGSQEGFAKMMNEKAKEVGATKTHFVTPNGLPNPDHLTTARDMALITQYALRNDTFRSIVNQYSYTIGPTNKKTESRHLNSENKLLYAKGAANKITVNGQIRDIFYEGAKGVKTGYTDAAQQCLVSYAKRGDMELIAVVFKSSGKNIWIDTHKLLDYGFNNFKSTPIAFKNKYLGNITVTNGEFPFVAGVSAEDLYVTLNKGTADKIEENIVLADTIDAPVYKDQVLGIVEYSANGQVIGKAKIIAAHDVNLFSAKKVKDPNGNYYKINKIGFWIAAVYIALNLIKMIYRIQRVARNK